MSKVKDVVDAAKTYVEETRRAWRETPGNAGGQRKLEGK